MKLNCPFLYKLYLGPASTIATVFNWFLAFLVSQFFSGLKDAIGGAYCFWIFAAVCAVGTAFVLLVLPETKGKTLDEIQALFGTPQPSTIPNNNFNTTKQGKGNNAYEPDQ